MISYNYLISHLINSGALCSKAVIESFKNVDRADFVLDPKVSDLYEDHPLQIGHSQTISQPTTVAMMLEMLDAKKGQKVLDIGSGSGWTTALLSYIVGDGGSVVGCERVDELIEFGNRNLEKYEFKNSQIIHATDKLGIPGEEFDRILVSAAAQQFPHELTEQLRVNGKLVIPVRNSIYEVTKRDDGTLDSVEHYGFTFVPLIY